MIGSLINVSDIFSRGISTSTQTDGKDQLAVARERIAGNQSKQGQDSTQHTSSPNQLEVSIGAGRPRQPGAIDVIEITDVGSLADADSFESQGLYQKAVGDQAGPAYGWRNHSQLSNRGLQRQRNGQIADSSNHIQARIEQPGHGLIHTPPATADLYVDKVSSDASAKNTQLQDIGQNSIVKKKGIKYGFGNYCNPPEIGGHASNDAEQSQGSAQKARSRNYIAAEENAGFIYCPPHRYGGNPNIGRVHQGAITDSLQGQALEQIATVDSEENYDTAPNQAKIEDIAYYGLGVLSGDVGEIDTAATTNQMQQDLADHLNSAPENGNDQNQLGIQHAASAYRGRARNSGLQKQNSAQIIGLGRRLDMIDLRH